MLKLSPMPSPFGMCHERFYILRGRDPYDPAGAYDSVDGLAQADSENVKQLTAWALVNLTPAEILALSEKLTRELETMRGRAVQQQPAGVPTGQWRDDAGGPAPFAGQPQRGGSQAPVKRQTLELGSDAAALSRSAVEIATIAQDAARRIRVDNFGIRAPAPRSKPAPSLAMDRALQSPDVKALADEFRALTSRIRIM